MPDPLPPGSPIGILGGGQLGRMLSVAASRLGLKTHIYEPGAAPPAGQVAALVTTAPYDAHIFQLAAYCLLVQRHYGKRPAYGILHYPNRTFAIDYTARLEEQLLRLLEEMHAQERRKDLPRSHDSPARCSRCGYRLICDQRLL